MIYLNSNNPLIAVDNSYSDMNNDVFTLYFKNMESVIIPCECLNYVCLFDGFFSKEALIELVLLKKIKNRKNAVYLLEELIGRKIICEKKYIFNNAFNDYKSVEQIRNKLSEYNIIIEITDKLQANLLKEILDFYGFNEVIISKLPTKSQKIDEEKLVIITDDYDKKIDEIADILVVISDYNEIESKWIRWFDYIKEEDLKVKRYFDALKIIEKVKEDVLYSILEGTGNV